MASLEVRIPIGQEKSMWTRAAYITKAVRQQVPDAHVRVTVGDISNTAEGSRPWRELGQDMELCFLPRNDFAKWAKTGNPNTGTIMERFKPPFNADHIILVDADTFPISDIMEPFTSKAREEDISIAGMPAHVTPFPGYHDSTWQRLSAGFFKDRDFIKRHSHSLASGYGIMDSNPTQRLLPAGYWNTGVVYASRWYLEGLWPHIEDALEFVRGAVGSYFLDQIALSLAIMRNGLPHEELDARWNFPNQPEFESAYPDQLADVRWIHFLRKNQVDREADFHDHDSVRNFVLNSALKGSNEVLRKAMAKAYRDINIERDK